MKILAIDPSFGDGDPPRYLVKNLRVKDGEWRIRLPFKEIGELMPSIEMTTEDVMKFAAKPFDPNPGK